MNDTRSPVIHSLALSLYFFIPKRQIKCAIRKNHYKNYINEVVLPTLLPKIYATIELPSCFIIRLQ